MQEHTENCCMRGEKHSVMIVCVRVHVVAADMCSTIVNELRLRITNELKFLVHKYVLFFYCPLFEVRSD